VTVTATGECCCCHLAPPKNWTASGTSPPCAVLPRRPPLPPKEQQPPPKALQYSSLRKRLHCTAAGAAHYYQGQPVGKEGGGAGTACTQGTPRKRGQKAGIRLPACASLSGREEEPFAHKERLGNGARKLDQDQSRSRRIPGWQIPPFRPLLTVGAAATGVRLALPQPSATPLGSVLSTLGPSPAPCFSSAAAEWRSLLKQGQI